MSQYGYGQQQQQYGYGQGQGYAPPPPQPQQQYGQPQQQPPYGQSQGYGYAPPPPPGQSYGGAPPPAPPNVNYGGHQQYAYNQQAPGMGGGVGANPPIQSQSYPGQPAYGAAPHQPPPSGHQSAAGGYHQPPPPQSYSQQPSSNTPPFYLGARLAVDPLAPYLSVPASIPGYYDPGQDVEVVRKATKGFGTDENALNRIFCLRAADQIQILAQAYKSRYGKDVIELIKKETSGYYETTLCSLAAGPLDADVELLHSSIAGAGTKETLLTEILVGRHPNELVLLRAAFDKRYHKSMDKEVLDDLSLKTKDAFAIVLQGRWQDGGYVQQDLIQRDVNELMPAFRLGFTNEMLISSIIFARSPVYLQALVVAFKQRNGKSLTNQIKQHFSGHLQEALLFAVEGGKRDGLGIWRDAKRLEAAMAGAGTKDALLIARLTRAHWDRNRFEQIKLAYQQKYKKPLADRVRGETSGHYRDCLLTLVKGQ